MYSCQVTKILLKIRILNAKIVIKKDTIYKAQNKRKKNFLHESQITSSIMVHHHLQDMALDNKIQINVHPT